MIPGQVTEQDLKNGLLAGQIAEPNLYGKGSGGWFGKSLISFLHKKKENNLSQTESFLNHLFERDLFV
jgi:hypothetical protein